MISVEVEKEINQENKVILNFTTRQIVCIIILACFTTLFVVISSFQVEVFIYPCFIVGFICALFGWYRPNGMPFEKILLKYLRTFMYKDNIRTYKTKNQYVTMLNDEYNRRRNIDLSDKRLAKRIKREQKDNEKRIKMAVKKSACKPLI